MRTLSFLRFLIIVITSMVKLERDASMMGIDTESHMVLATELDESP